MKKFFTLAHEYKKEPGLKSKIKTIIAKHLKFHIPLILTSDEKNRFTKTPNSEVSKIEVRIALCTYRFDVNKNL